MLDQRASSHHGASTSSKDSANGDNALVHSYPACAGEVPSERYGHASAIVDTMLYVYGEKGA